MGVKARVAGARSERAGRASARRARGADMLGGVRRERGQVGGRGIEGSRGRGVVVLGALVSKAVWDVELRFRAWRRGAGWG